MCVCSLSSSESLVSASVFGSGLTSVMGKPSLCFCRLFSGDSLVVSFCVFGAGPPWREVGLRSRSISAREQVTFLEEPEESELIGAFSKTSWVMARTNQNYKSQ